MRDRAKENRSGCGKFFLPTVGVAALAVLGLAVALTTPVSAQAPAGQSPSAQSPTAPQWQIDAGSKLEFDVASVKQNKCGLPPSCLIDSNIDLLPGDAFFPTGGLFTETNWYLMPLIVFAYKLDANHYQLLESQLPTWARTERFDIQARGPGNPTKDQFRLMMQALLADRFKLAVHFETRQLPVFAVVLNKPGKLGPTLRQHSDDPPCAPSLPANVPSPVFRETVAGGYPALCDVSAGGIVSGRFRQSARNVSIERIGTRLGPIAQLGRPIVDHTGLNGNFDYIIEWTYQPNRTPTDGGDAQPDPTETTFLQALKDQLGLKLEPTTGPVDVLVVDHIEEPSPN